MDVNKGKRVLALPRTPGKADIGDPEHFNDVRMIEMTHEQFIKLGQQPRQEAVLVAADINQDSLRTRVLKAVASHSPVADIEELIGYLQQDGAPHKAIHHHEVTHLLYGLNKTGCLKFRENKRDSREGTAHLQRIEITEAGFVKAGVPVPGRQQEGRYGQRNAGTSRKGHAVGTDYTEARHHPARAIGGEVLRISPPTGSKPDEAGARAFEASAALTTVRAAAARQEAPQATPPAPPSHKPRINEEPTEMGEWPELQLIRVKAEEADAVTRRAHVLLEAAALLEEVDPDEAERLLTRATALQTGTELTPLEDEYLRFADGR